MIVKYTLDQMLATWRTMAGLEPSLAEASVERFDSVDVERRLFLDMRAWYLDYLREAPLDRVPVSDITDKVRVVAGPGRDWWKVGIVGDVVRIVDIELAGLGPVKLIDPDDPAYAGWLERLRNRMWRVGCCPVAVYKPGASTLLLKMASSNPPEVTLLRAVMTDTDDYYYVDEREIAALKDRADASNL